MSYEDSMRLVSIVDSLICLVNTKSTKDTVKVKSRFLTLFPSQPKLINLDLQMDTLDVTLLNIQAELYTLRYPLNLFNWKYRYDGFQMSTKQLPSPYGKPKYSKWGFEVSGYLGSNVISYPSLIPYLSAEGRVNYASVTLSVEPFVTINKAPELGINAKVGYKIWSWPKK